MGAEVGFERIMDGVEIDMEQGCLQRTQMSLTRKEQTMTKAEVTEFMDWAREQTMIDIGADLQRAFDEGYEKGKAEMYEHMKNRLDDEYDAGYCTGKSERVQGDDLIRRSDAIEAIKDHSFALGDDYMEINGYGAIDDIRALPSADRWIPCEERLPDKDTEVLVVDYNEAMQVCSVSSYKGMPVWEDVYGYWHGIEVFDAWMPLPKPWKGADDE